ncbi:MAG: ABC transporter ATP-binding protein [Myxococcota bacterium]
MLGVQVEELVVRLPRPGAASKTLFSIPRWRVEPSARVCIAGASGSGKTTLLHVLAGLRHPSAGRVTVGQTTLTDLEETARDAFRARNIGLVFQTARLLPALTALENVALAASVAGIARAPARERARALLEQVGVAARASGRPTELSVGERQRVAIARALAAEPGLLLADEPTASLDPARTDGTITLLHDIAERHGTTVVLVTHEREVQARFDTVIRLEDLITTPSAESA